MNIAFFLIPKNEVTYLPIHNSMRQALEKMEYHRYTAVPLIDECGKYAGTLTEGDLLWKLKNTPNLAFADTEKIKIRDIPRRMVNTPVRVDAQMEDLLSLVIVQNFVPVVDDSEIFIGIIRRREIIEYYANQLAISKP
ncbi:CBS domain-containing protein [Propionispora hippei]|uniref:CBS domain-containing protein n=1 Tax=Propionispora hippei DSM 15287 TaxID=1123003 RepID=A0A1M6IZC1_9FIRM|nr:CBS domain-containing protein [Propionispora hippei]SHJ39809.1 CBS domain-containing protein [Propionispora hippei DSM 15287]